MSRQEFYESTAKEIKNLFEIHMKFNDVKVDSQNTSSDNNTCFIEDIPWL